MHDETIPAPLMHGGEPERSETPPPSSLAPLWIAGGVVLLCVIAALLR